MTAGTLARVLTEGEPSTEPTPLASENETRWWRHRYWEESTPLISTSQSQLRTLLAPWHVLAEETATFYIDSFSIPWAARWTAKWTLPTILGTTAHQQPLGEQVHAPEAPRSLRAAQAVEELRRWLDLTLDDVAALGGFSRRSWYHWRSGMDPRPSSARRLFQVHGVVRTLVDRLGPSQVRSWLREPGDDRRPRFELFDDADGPAKVLREAADLLFEAARPPSESWMRPDFATEDLEVTSKPAQFGPPIRRTRRRGDR